MPSLVSLSALKSRALRRGAWFRVGPAAGALIDAAILYLKRGGRIKSPALAEALRKAAEEVLRLTTPIRILAKAVGYAVARQLGVEVDEERATALGLQWLNTPKRWKSRGRALYLHVNRRRGVSRPGDGGEPKRHREKLAQIDAGGKEPESAAGKNIPGAPHRTERRRRTPAEP